QTQELWTPDRAARIDAVMAAPGDPSVRAQWQQARLDLEAWAKRLHVTRDALCNGPAPHIEATCAFDRRARLEVFLNELEGLGPHEVERAAPALLDAVASMRTPQTCLAGDTPIPLSLRPLRQALWSLETRIALHRPQAALAAWVPIAAEVE